MEALRVKYDGVGQPYGRKDFDQLLGHCQAVSDLPAVVFSEELIRAYPDAKVVLTLRDVDAWYESNLKTVHAIHNKPTVSSLMRLSLTKLDWLFRTRARYARPMYQKLQHNFYEGDFERNGRCVFEEHYARIRTLVPKDRLLEYKFSDGWAPLCKFLDVTIPDAAFPSGNDVLTFRGRFRAAYRYKVNEMLNKFALMTCGVVLLGLAIRFFYGRGTLPSISLP